MAHPAVSRIAAALFARARPGPTVDSTIGALRSKTPNDRAKRGYSLIGGVLIGTSVSLPVLTLDAGEGYGALTLAVSLLLTLIGLRMHRSVSK